jgi:uracil-DNA glycosylase
MQQTTGTHHSQHHQPDVGREIALEDSWKSRLLEEFQKPYMQKLKTFLKSEKQKKKIIYPPGPEIFTALNSTPFEDVRVVILGQDPYHGPGQAHGLSFSVKDGVPFPPSLQNILKELHNDLGYPMPKSGNLIKWAKHGVLLLNASLTVEQGKPMSHQNAGWEQFTDKIIHLLNEEREHLVFILWGSFAQKKAQFVDRKKHLVIASPHPSPLSAHRGFFGSKPFSKANAYLKSHGMKPIDWDLS